MVGGSTHQQPQASQFAPPRSPSSTAPAATTEEEEFLKRNTDCVYFLASPLTCKKGSECEYRHSDIARVNPRDCWYWLNGNCLNPKCAFRHPPLDGLLGAEVAPPVGPSLPQAPVTPAPYPMSKQGVACIFFQKGFCLKGNLCPFLHGPPNTVNNKAAPPVPSNQVTKPPKTDPAKPIQEQKFVQQETLQKPSEFLPPQKKQPPAPARNGSGSGGGMEKKVAPPPEESAWYRPANVVPPPVTRSNHGGYSDNEGIMNGKDVEEYSREPTPGFDVLVDNELGESEYYPNEEQYGRRSRDHDFDIGRPVDFDVDRDTYGEQRNYDHGEGYSWEDHRQERILSGGRKRYPRDESPDQFDKSDLRHRISKQRRGNVGGLRSVVSRENPRDSHERRENHHHHHHSHNHRVEPSSLSSRLRGRIKIPGRSISPGNENGSRVEREIYTGRIRDRVKGRAVDDYRGFHGRYDKDNDFTGPPKRWEKDDKRKYNQQSDGNTSFEGPKPLSEILKRKRGGSVNNNEDKENNEKETKEIVNVKPEELEKQKNDEVAMKVGLIDEDAILDEELEAYDHKDGDYDYEQIDGEEYNLEEGEEEYLEEEDDGGKKESEVYT